MTDEEKNELVKNVTDEEENVISIYLNVAKQTILNKLYPFINDDEDRTWLSKYDLLQCRMAIYLVEKQGAEGETSHSENGVSRMYSSADIPNALLNEITPFAKCL